LLLVLVLRIAYCIYYYYNKSFNLLLIII